MKAIQIIDTLNVGGAEMMAVNIANSLANNGLESHICTTRKEGQLKNKINNNVGYLFLNKKKKNDFKAVKKLARYVRKEKIQILHAHSSSFFIAVCVKLLNPKIKIIWHDHFGDSEFLTNKSRKSIQKVSFLFSSVIAVNTTLIEWSKKNLKVKDYHLLNNFAVFGTETPQTHLKGIMGKRIVLVAGFREQKDHINLLKAFSIVLKEKNDWTLHLIGKVHKGKYSDLVKNFIVENNLSKNVFIYGVCSDIKHILNQSTIGVLSSKSEGLPISLLEYGLAELPVLVTDVGECSKVVKNSKGITPSNDSNKYADSLLTIIENESIRNTISFELSQTVMERYSERFVTDNIIEIYNKVNNF